MPFPAASSTHRYPHGETEATGTLCTFPSSPQGTPQQPPIAESQGLQSLGAEAGGDLDHIQLALWGQQEHPGKPADLAQGKDLKSEDPA